MALTKDLCQRIKVPKDARNLALLVARFHGTVHHATELKATTIADMLQAVDAYRKPERFKEFLQACACDFHGRPGFAEKPYYPSEHLKKALTAAKSVDAGAIATQLSIKGSGSIPLPVAINSKVREARIAKIKTQLA